MQTDWSIRILHAFHFRGAKVYFETYILRIAQKRLTIYVSSQFSHARSKPLAIRQKHYQPCGIRLHYCTRCTNNQLATNDTIVIYSRYTYRVPSAYVNNNIIFCALVLKHKTNNVSRLFWWALSCNTCTLQQAWDCVVYYIIIIQAVNYFHWHISTVIIKWIRLFKPL